MFHKLNETDLWSQTPCRLWVGWGPRGRRRKEEPSTKKLPQASSGPRVLELIISHCLESSLSPEMKEDQDNLVLTRAVRKASHARCHLIAYLLMG